MLQAFFSTAMTAPGRQLTFRRAAAVHLVFVAGLAWALENTSTTGTLTLIGYALVVAGIVEGAVLIGWRLAQLPKSQSLEFLLASPVHPRRLFVAEALVGMARLGLITLAGLPILLLLLLTGRIDVFDLIPMLVMPFTWGAITGIGLVVWSYETRIVKRIGEWFAIGGVLVYLVVGVLAGERLRNWLQALPPETGQFLFDIFRGFHEYNPFGVMEYWLNPQRVAVIAIERMVGLQIAATALFLILLTRAAFRLKGHFVDRHYRPVIGSRADQCQYIRDKPLSWWAVRRVMEYSGRINLWLAGGFSLLYAAYLVSENHWPEWMGRLVFQIFERLGGAPALVTAMVVLAAVPAAFQYGVWDSSAQDRSRRLELLLLTELDGEDYWHASLSAAWRRGRGYFGIAIVLWSAMRIAGRIDTAQLAASIAAAIILWNFAFAVGFACFGSGRQANGIGAFLTLGLPLVAFLSMRIGSPFLASLFPPGSVFLALSDPPRLLWCVGPLIVATFTLWLAHRSLTHCDANLRAWYDRSGGGKILD